MPVTGAGHCGNCLWVHAIANGLSRMPGLPVNAHVALFSPNDIRVPLEAIGVRVFASWTAELLAA
jgi:hypothetical protein